MFISKQLLQKFHENRAARRALSALPRSTASDNALESLKSAKKVLWAEVHSTLRIPVASKLKLEMDGELAGELRYKLNGGVVSAPVSAPQTAPQAQAPQEAVQREVARNEGETFVFVDEIGENTFVVRSLAELKSKLDILDLSDIKLLKAE
jgi:hypothetical protein